MLNNSIRDDILTQHIDASWFPGDQLFWSLFFQMALQDGQDAMTASCTAWARLRGEWDLQSQGFDAYLDEIRPAVAALVCHDLGGL